MPLNLCLAAPGSPCRLLLHTTRFSSILHPSVLIGVYRVNSCRTACTSCIRPATPFTAAPKRFPTAWTRHGIPSEGHEHPVFARRHYSNGDGPAGDAADIYLSLVGIDDGATEAALEEVSEDGEVATRSGLHSSRATKKAQRQSRPALILDAIHNPARDLYMLGPPGTVDVSYTSPRRRMPGGAPRRSPASLPPIDSIRQDSPPVSLHSILARYLYNTTIAPWAEADFVLNKQELELLNSDGYSLDSVKSWAATLVTHRSLAAAEIFKPGHQMPPLFLLLLFLRRKHIRTAALGVVMRHIQFRVEVEPINWMSLKILMIRLLRHARMLWPETMPWIASIFCAQATRIYDEGVKSGGLSKRISSDLTHFCNTLLSLLSLPASVRPVLSALYAETAQFRVLHFMANCEPALIVTRSGFRSVTRVQLAHAKTPQEKEWAELKGPSWPPWKESRTAMDEDKGYEFGASRASRILHRMYEAGYEGRTWEELTEIYAGWDIDLSPTIQTRTSLPRFSTRYGDRARLGAAIWAARIRTTRTRREAWACFLAHETSNTPSHGEIYLAMFEKLHYPEIRQEESNARHGRYEEHDQPSTSLLPGDVKEALSDPKSPLHLVHISEPVPTYEQLYHRMNVKNIQPTNHLLAFLVETYPDFDPVLQLIESAKVGFGSELQHLLSGKHLGQPVKQRIPGYLFAACIRFLCRFGRFSRLPSTEPAFRPPEEHESMLQLDRHYLLEYAHALLLHYKPQYRPAWTAYMQKVLFNESHARSYQHRRTHKGITQTTIKYRIVCNLIAKMEEIDLEIDDEQFQLVCLGTRYAAQSALKGILSAEDVRFVFETGSHRLRTLFHELVGANFDFNAPMSWTNKSPIPPHTPGPDSLHTYVRALGILGDHEGLYSFSTWITSNHAEVTARAHAQHGGPKNLLRTVVALRAAMEGVLERGQKRAPEEIRQLVKAQVEVVEAWGGWPSDDLVLLYTKDRL